MARDIMKLYREKHCSAEQAMASIKPGFWIDYGFFNGKPQLCDRALAARRDELSDVTILAAVTLPPPDRFDQTIINQLLHGSYGLTTFHADIAGESFIARIRLPILAGILAKLPENQFCC